LGTPATPPNDVASAAAMQRVSQAMGSVVLVGCLLAVVNLSVADALGETPETAQSLAKKLGANADVLGRVLRLLAQNGIFEEANGAFRHTSVSRMLRADHPASLRGTIRLCQTALPLMAALDHSVRTGQAAADKIMPGGFWKYLADHPEDGATFDEAMRSKANLQIAGLMRTYDFSKFSSLADVGGGRGQFLRAILNAYPQIKGVLFDLPQVIDKVTDRSVPRLSFSAGDFFKDDLPACDGYLLTNILHDWPDGPAVSILKNVRRAAPAGSRLLVAELLVPEGHDPRSTVAGDITMLLYSAGRERKRSEYEVLFNASGWRLQRVYGAPGFLVVLECAAV